LGAIAWVVFPEGFWGLIVGLLVLIPTHNILYMSVAGLSTMLSVALLLQRPIEIFLFICGTWAVIFLASLPDVVATLTTAGGVAAYLREPDGIYRQEAKQRKKN
jgi:hypothetical protein